MDQLKEGLVDVAVLDDDVDFLQYMEDFLRDEGRYSVRPFDEPAGMLAAFEERPPEILLLDMKMGDYSGENVLEQVQSRWPKTCVVIVTGFPSLEDMRATFRRKVFDYIAKPFSLAQMRTVLKNAVEAFELGQAPFNRLRERLGHRIKMLRTERDWSLKDLAAQTRLSVSQISAIERGAHLPSIESLLAICRAFERKPSDVLGSIGF